MPKCVGPPKLSLPVGDFGPHLTPLHGSVLGPTPIHTPNGKNLNQVSHFCRTYGCGLLTQWHTHTHRPQNIVKAVSYASDITAINTDSMMWPNHKLEQIIVPYLPVTVTQPFVKQILHVDVHSTYTDNVALPAFTMHAAACHCSWASAVQQLTDIDCLSGHSNKPAASGLLLWSRAGTNRWTDRRTDRRRDTVPLHTLCSAWSYYAGSANKLRTSVTARTLS